MLSSSPRDSEEIQNIKVKDSFATKLVERKKQFYMNQAKDDRRPNEIAAYVCGFSLALTVVIARAVSRIRAKIKFGLDDWMIFFATVCVVQPSSRHSDRVIGVFGRICCGYSTVDS